MGKGKGGGGGGGGAGGGGQAAEVSTRFYRTERFSHNIHLVCLCVCVSACVCVYMWLFVWYDLHLLCLLTGMMAHERVLGYAYIGDWEC